MKIFVAMPWLTDSYVNCFETVEIDKKCEATWKIFHHIYAYK